MSRFLGKIALDGSKIRANANKHKALSYAHAQKIEAQLYDEVKALLAHADEVDRDGIIKHVMGWQQFLLRRLLVALTRACEPGWKAWQWGGWVCFLCQMTCLVFGMAHCV